jgi:murein DD-endopeptidase MepM/ murein hydrolase activator NlpD
METISASVGNKAINRYKDVAIVQTLLNNNLHRLKTQQPLAVDGACGPKTIDLIIQFQMNIVRLNNPDGRVDPWGCTLQNLNSGSREPILNGPSPMVQPIHSICFPLGTRPAQSYKTGMRRFGANRKGDRKHAGVDLYAPVGSPIYAMDEGEITNGPYAFYLGTQAIEIKHPQFLARYGEIRDVADGLKMGEKVTKGQLIGYVGQLRGLNMSMLHLELYKDSASGSLTVRGNKPFHRRSDLIDPTTLLDKAQCNI